MKVDLNKRDIDMINSARKIASFSEEINRQPIVYNFKPQPSKRDEILVAGAEANIEQLELLKDELQEMQNQNNMLATMLDNQIKAGEEDKKELKKSKRYNRWMMVITVAALLVAIVEILSN